MVKAQKYTFHCRFKTEARLPGYLGSTLRGALGWGLKRTSCALKRQQCETCLLREQCAYAWIFETERYKAGDGRIINARPHPFVLQPEMNCAGHREQGTDLNFSLLLFDRANEFLPQLVYAIQMMGEAGVGSGRRQGLGRFQLEKVSTEEEELFNAENSVLKKCIDIPLLHLEDMTATETGSVRLILQTPLRLKQNNKLGRVLPFHVLIRTTLRRIAALEDAYGGGEPDLDYRGLVQRAETIETAESSIRWQELFRYSNRQRKKVSLSGLAGSVSYHGLLTEFVPLLRYAEQVNIGKQTVFGLGKVDISFFPVAGYTREPCNIATPPSNNIVN
ncbi:MAG: CRISPR system precrRNA processing endoribonuclease RAMP protein Cas6 [Thermodesulfobacteriota bacterium]|nr:CRISPR system precrRNA processing endoribonuclease RAMP protein Cas6 [Thermodesulfobacteriota bacterium]